MVLDGQKSGEKVFVHCGGAKETNGGYWHGKKRESSPRRRGCVSRREEWMVIGKGERERAVEVEVEVATRSGNHVRSLEPQSLQTTFSLSLWSVLSSAGFRLSSEEQRHVLSRSAVPQRLL